MMTLPLQASATRYTKKSPDQEGSLQMLHLAMQSATVIQMTCFADSSQCYKFPKVSVTVYRSQLQRSDLRRLSGAALATNN